VLLSVWIFEKAEIIWRGKSGGEYFVCTEEDDSQLQTKVKRAPEGRK
jgi:hypothetical protein